MEILFYFSRPPYFGHGFTPDTSPVSSLRTRKSFLSQLGGLVAAAGLAPRALLARVTPPVATAPVRLQPETRAVARRPDRV